MIKLLLSFFLAAPAAGAELAPLTKEAIASAEIPAPPPPAADKASAINIVTSVSLKVRNDKGEVRISFPKKVFIDPEPGDESPLFIKVQDGQRTVVSWATVICSGGRYLGYKGSTYRLPDADGDFSVQETLALGFPGSLITSTHPWLFEKLPPGSGPQALCAAGAQQALAEYSALTLPPSAGRYRLAYDAQRNSLRINWK